MTAIEEIISNISLIVGFVLAEVFANAFLVPRYPNWFKKDDNGRLLDSYGLIDIITEYFKKRKEKKEKQKNNFSSQINV
jgi:hypothetical protein